MENRNSNVVHAAASTESFLNGDSTEALFVINLVAANMPQAIDAHSVQSWGIPGLEQYRLYQVSRMEEGRRRYRVRLGFFTSEANAEIVLRTVRGRFASAFATCLCDEDLKHASGYLKKPLNEIQEIQDLQRTGRYKIPTIAQSDLPPGIDSRNGIDSSNRMKIPAAVARPAPPAPVAKPAARSGTPIVAQPKHPPAPKHGELVEFEWTPDQNVGARTRSRAPVAAPPAPTKHQRTQPNTHTHVANGAKQPVTPKAPLKPQPSKAIAPKSLTVAPSTVAQPTPAARSTGQPFHVGAGRAIPDHGLSLQREAVKAQPAHAVTQPPAKVSNDLPRPLVSAEALAKLRAAAQQPRNQSSVIPTLDSTQTIRTLTKTEVEDANAPKWFVVQLAISDQPANLDTMPRLDIFEAYRLYSVAIMEGTLIRHALRLGFFKEQVSAEAVLGYLKTFFGDPHIERISDAEQRRFAEPPAQKAKAPIAEPAKSQARVITLEEKRGKTGESIPPAAISTPAKIVSKAAAPVKRSAPVMNGKAPKKSAKTTRNAVSQDEIDEARLLGLSETAIRRVEHNPSLLSRLVDKLTK
jgi:hypothetical protein